MYNGNENFKNLILNENIVIICIGDKDKDQSLKNKIKTILSKSIQ